jgi:hypothetical protein
MRALFSDHHLSATWRPLSGASLMRLDLPGASAAGARAVVASIRRLCPIMRPSTSRSHHFGAVRMAKNDTIAASRPPVTTTFGSCLLAMSSTTNEPIDTK